MSLYAGNCSEHVCTLLIGYRSGGTPGFPHILRARDGIAGRRRGSSACQRPSNLPALSVARRCSPVGFDHQQVAYKLSAVEPMHNIDSRLSEPMFDADKPSAMDADKSSAMEPMHNIDNRLSEPMFDVDKPSAVRCDNQTDE